MAKSKFIVTGIAEIDKGLRQLERAEGAKIIRQAIRKNQKTIQKASIEKAPKNTGALRKNIKLKAGKRSNQHISIYTRQEMVPGNPKPYPFFQEYGDPKRGKAPVGYLRRAFDENANKVKDQTIEDIQQGVTDWWHKK